MFFCMSVNFQMENEWFKFAFLLGLILKFKKIIHMYSICTGGEGTFNKLTRPTRRILRLNQIRDELVEFKWKIN